MPNVVHFKKDSLIYCNGDESDKVFILKSGRVRLVYDDIETGKIARETVMPGEFFGVRSALGRYPREENAIVSLDSVMAAFSVTEFELFAMSNTEIILRMLKVFSNQMRRIHTQVSSLLNKEEIKPDDGLFRIGEKYMKSKRYSHALYIFNRYLDYYPDGKDTEEAVKHIQFAEAVLAQTPSGKPLPEAAGKKTATEAGVAAFNASNFYYNGINLIKKEKFHDAMEAFSWVVSNSNETSLWTAKSVYEIGRCLYFMDQFENCINHYQKMFGKFPKHPDMEDAMFYMGQANEKIGKKNIAVDWYKKIIAVPGNNTGGTRAKALQALEALGG